MTRARERELRVRIARVVGHEPPGPVWDLLEEEGYLAAVRNAPEDAEASFKAADAARRFERALEYATKDRRDREQLSRRRRAVAPGPAPLGSLEKARAEAFSAYIARMAEARISLGIRQDDVTQFRAEFLRGGPLRPSAARELLSSPLPRYLRKDQFDHFDIPVVGHQGRIIERTIKPEDDGEGYETEWVRLGVDNPAAGKGRSRILPPMEQRLVERHYLAMPGHHQELVAVWRDSMFYRLAWVAARLAHRYPWTECDAAWFVLTGESPHVAPIFARTEVRRRLDHNYGRVVLEVSPWVPPVVVAEAFRRETKDMTGQRSRSIGERAVALFRFINEQVNQPGRRPGWEELRVLWNRTCRKKQDWMASTAWTLSRDFRAAERMIVFPSYPGVPGEDVFTRLRRPRRRRSRRRRPTGVDS